jgi:hypothetical protein
MLRLSDAVLFMSSRSMVARIVESKQKPKRKQREGATLDFESFIRAALQTGKPPAQKKKAAKRRPRKGGK